MMKKAHGAVAGTLFSVFGLLTVTAWASSDGLPPVPMDAAWSTDARATYISGAPETAEKILETLDTFLFSGDVQAFRFDLDSTAPGFLLFLR